MKSLKIKNVYHPFNYRHSQFTHWEAIQGLNGVATAEESGTHCNDTKKTQKASYDV